MAAFFELHAPVCRQWQRQSRDCLDVPASCFPLLNIVPYNCLVQGYAFVEFSLPSAANICKQAMERIEYEMRPDVAKRLGKNKDGSDVSLPLPLCLLQLLEVIWLFFPNQRMGVSCCCGPVTSEI